MIDKQLLEVIENPDSEGTELISKANHTFYGGASIAKGHV